MILASQKTAVLAGIWSGVGLDIWDVWLDRRPGISILSHDLLWLVALTVFFFLPVYFFVLGHGNKPFARDWISNPEERARYGAIAKRMLAWFITAAAIVAAWSLLSTALR